MHDETPKVTKKVSKTSDIPIPDKKNIHGKCKNEGKSVKNTYKNKRKSVMSHNHSNISFRSPNVEQIDDIPNKIHEPPFKPLSMRRLTLGDHQNNWILEKPGIDKMQGYVLKENNDKQSRKVNHCSSKLDLTSLAEENLSASIKYSFNRTAKFSEITNSMLNNSLSVGLSFNIPPKMTGFMGGK